ncbi:flavin reductase family protein [Rhodococcus opacus]|uniref:flavin reductase family protein n=1 Tax=Rhodococcus opacus TaxID=37919 RepID=UPI000AE0E3F4|nr:flavin reductase family protein [Rhodococcus opacus]
MTEQQLSPEPLVVRKFSDRELRSAFGRFVSGVTVVTCAKSDGTAHGATVTAFTSISLDPALCQVTLTRKSKACGYLGGAPFTVNILAADQVETALHFAGRPQPSPPVLVEGPTSPQLVGNAATVSCHPWRTYDGGDHLIVIGEIAALEVTDQNPLLFSRGVFHDLGGPVSAAVWEKSMDDPHCGWFDATTVRTPSYLYPPAAHSRRSGHALERTTTP